MARGRGVDRKGRSKTQGRFLALPHHMTGSAAWRSLSGNSVKVFVELARRYDGKNNGRIAMSLEQAAKALGIGKQTVQRSLAELAAKGFIMKTARGDFYSRMAATYRLTLWTTETGSATDDWRAWRRPEKTERGSEMSRDRSVSDPRARS